MLGNSLFDAVRLTENVDLDKYSYSGHNIGFDARGFSSMSDSGRIVKNVIIFGADMNATVHVDNKKKIS